MRQAPTTQTTKSGTSASSTAKKAKKTKVETNLSAVTSEDLALDRELDRLAATQTPEFDDLPAANTVTKTKEEREMLESWVDGYKPAASLLDLDEQTLMCQEFGADSIEAIDQIFRKFCGAEYKDPYFVYKGVKVYRAGNSLNAKSKEGKTVDQINFPMK